MKEKIRKAIVSKGVNVREGASLSEMADKILEIKVESNQRDAGPDYLYEFDLREEKNA